MYGARRKHTPRVPRRPLDGVADDALLMPDMSANSTRPPGSRGSRSRMRTGSRPAPPGAAAAALARADGERRRRHPRRAAASARDLLQKPRPPPSAPPLPTLPPLQQHWQPPEIIDFEDDDDEDDEDYERRRCCCCFTRGHEPDDVFSRKWLKRLCFLHVVLGFALFWLLVLAVVLFPSSSTFGALRDLPLRVLVRCLACGLCALTALRVPLDARELNATLPKAALAKVLDTGRLLRCGRRSCRPSCGRISRRWRTTSRRGWSPSGRELRGRTCPGVCAWVAVTPLCLGDLLPIAAREKAETGGDEEEDDREDVAATAACWRRRAARRTWRKVAEALSGACLGQELAALQEGDRASKSPVVPGRPTRPLGDDQRRGTPRLARH